MMLRQHLVHKELLDDMRAFTAWLDSNGYSLFYHVLADCGPWVLIEVEVEL